MSIFPVISTLAGEVERESIPNTLPFKLSIADANLGVNEWSAKYALPFSIDMVLTAMANSLACEGSAVVPAGTFAFDAFDVVALPVSLALSLLADLSDEATISLLTLVCLASSIISRANGACR